MQVWNINFTFGNPSNLWNFLCKTMGTSSLISSVIVCSVAEPFHWVMSWKNILPHQHFVSLMEKSFFPRWIQVLRKWLCNQPNYDEVTKWYIGWKSMFSEDLLANATIKAQFNRALDIMNHAVTGTLQPGARENIAYLTSTERRLEIWIFHFLEKIDRFFIANSARSPYQKINSILFYLVLFAWTNISEFLSIDTRFKRGVAQLLQDVCWLALVHFTSCGTCIEYFSYIYPLGGRPRLQQQLLQRNRGRR